VYRLGNGLKTALLLGVLSALILLIGQALGGVAGLVIAGCGGARDQWGGLLLL
jgi:heat shock protein HtpX